MDRSMIHKDSIIDVSIIIPVYNAEKYLKRCIDSVINQIYKSWELILVDDGSTDSSALICDVYAKADSRIKVIHKPNGGVSSARNAGIDVANGKYIVFIDSDDWVSNRYIHDLMDAPCDAQLVISGFDALSAHGATRLVISVDKGYSLTAFKHNFAEALQRNVVNSPVGKRYAREIIGNLRFDKSIALGEDLLFNLAYMEKCNLIREISQCNYYYNRTNEESATRKLRLTDFEQTIRLFHAKKEFVSSSDNDANIEEIEKNLFAMASFLMQMLCVVKPENYKAILKDWMNNKDFQHVCKSNYHFTGGTRILQIICRLRWTFAFQIAVVLKQLCMGAV